MATRLAAVVAACLSAAPALAQSAWPPPPPDVSALARVAIHAPPVALGLKPGVVEQLLPRLAELDAAGLGSEARRAAAWAEGRKDFSLEETEGGKLRDGTGAALAVSPALAAAIRRADGYFGITPATLASPPTHQEIVSAALSPEGVEAIAAVFERTIADRLATPTGAVVPEAGGEAALDGGLRLHEIPELTRETMRLVARAAADPDELARLYASRPETMKLIDENGLLANFLRLRVGWQARGMPQEKQDGVLRLTIDTILHNASDAYVFDPASQMAAIVSQDWSGRYLGRWHTHPPGAGAAGFKGADVPSPPDMDIAVAEGQNLVFSFQPDGFDLYDLAPLAGAKPDLSRILKDSYRSQAWNRRFQALFDRAFAPR